MLNNSKQMARIGEFLIHEAILQVLSEYYDSGFGIGPKQISDLTGLYRGEGSGKYHDGLVQNFLIQLLELNKIESKSQGNQKGGWMLTKKEYEIR